MCTTRSFLDDSSRNGDGDANRLGNSRSSPSYHRWICTWVALVLPNDAADEEIARLSDEYKLARGFLAIEGKAQGERIVSLEPRSGCFCGISLGRLETPPSHAPDFVTKKTRALRRKGWSEAKIERWLDELDRRERREDVRREAMEAKPDPHNETWAAFFREILETDLASRVGIVVYEAGDRVELRRGDSVSLDDFDVSHLERMALDEILTVS